MKKFNRPANRRRFASVTLFAFLVTFFIHPQLFQNSVQADTNVPVSLTTLGTAYTQNFDTLVSTGTGTLAANTPAGWGFVESGANANTTYTAGTGSSNTGDTYSFGAANSSERAFGQVDSGSLSTILGARFANNTGSTITSLDIAYIGEQWRSGDTTNVADVLDFEYSTDATSLTTGTWTSVNPLDFAGPQTTATAGALDGNAAANRAARSQSIASLSIANGANFWIRWVSTNISGSDDGLSIDDFSITPQGAVAPTPNLTINDVSQAEGNTGTTTFTFTVTLSAPAGPGGVTFNIATADGTAQDDNPASEDNDYVAKSLTGQTIPAGSSSYAFNVAVNGDTTAEPNETFFVNVTNVVGATVGDGQGQGTITNDDITVTPIHDIQGNGAASPLAGSTVSTTGVVTLLRTGSNAGSGSAANGFFLQTPDANADADPNTSQGIFVFTSSVPTVAVGDEIIVTGTVVEFNGLTEISPVSNVTVIDTGNPLPSAVTLTQADLSPTAAPDQSQLEKYEAMRVSAASLTTVAPNDNFYDVDTVLTGVARPLREPGIPASDPVPPDPTSGTPDPNIPRWDENPERLRVDTNGRAGAANQGYTSGVTFTNVAGPLDFAFGRYRLVAEAAPNASENISAVPVRAAEAGEFSVVGYNIIFFQNDPTQREKVSLTIRNILRYPDIIGLVEIDDLDDLQALAADVNADAVTAGDPDPQYEAYLLEGNCTADCDQNVAFLVKTSRVSVESVVQRNVDETFINPNNGNSEILNDRPPLVLRGSVKATDGYVASPVIVIVNHLRSFIDAELVGGDGPRVRAKRKAQAESLARLLEEYQTSDPTTPIVSVGDYNAFEFNNGYDDPISVIKGNPTPDDQIVVDQSPDYVDPNFINLIENVPADQRYTFIFEGTPQVLDHVLVNDVANSRNTGVAIAHVNADFPDAPAAAYRTNVARPERNSDHDPTVSFFSRVAVPTADLSITKTDGVTQVATGGSLTYTIVATNNGPNAVTGATVTDTFPAELTNVTWTCVGSGGGTCTASGSGNISDTVNLPSGASVTYTVSATVSASASGTLSNTATIAAPAGVSDPTPGNNSATDTTTIISPSVVSGTKTVSGGSGGVYAPGSTVTYTVTLNNNGQSAQLDNPGDEFVDVLPASLTLVSATATSGAVVANTGTNTVTFNGSIPANGSVTITITATINAGTAGQTVSNQGTINYDADGNGTNESTTVTDDPSVGGSADPTSFTVVSTPDLALSMIVSPDPVAPGANLTYQITLNNSGGAAQGVVLSQSDSFRQRGGTRLVVESITAPPGWTCQSPNPVFDPAFAEVVCRGNLGAGQQAQFTIVKRQRTPLPLGIIIYHEAEVRSETVESNTQNNRATDTTRVGNSTPR